jgi:prolyl oligopeptidase
MAYSEVKGGSDWKTIYIKDVETGKNLEDELMWIKFSGASWSKDNKGFFYSRYEVPKSYLNKDKKEDVSGKQGQETDKLENMKVYYHKLGQKQSEDALLFEYPE